MFSMNPDEFDFEERESYDLENGEIIGLAIVIDLPQRSRRDRSFLT